MRKYLWQGKLGIVVLCPIHTGSRGKLTTSFSHLPGCLERLPGCRQQFTVSVFSPHPGDGVGLEKEVIGAVVISKFLRLNSTSGFLFMELGYISRIGLHYWFNRDPSTDGSKQQNRLFV